MAYPDPVGMPGQPGIQPEEVHALSSLLGSLLSLLQQFQPSPATPGTGLPQSWNYSPGPDFRAGPDFSRLQIDRQAAIAFAEDIAADSLRRLAAYCESQGLPPGLEACIDRATEAAQCFANRDYNGCLFLVWQAYRTVAAAKAANPDLPTLGEPPTGATVGGTSAKLH